MKLTLSYFLFHNFQPVTESRLCRDLNELEDLSVDDLVRLYDQQMTRLLNVR